jgi:hypothetical protein
MCVEHMFLNIETPSTLGSHSFFIMKQNWMMYKVTNVKVEALLYIFQDHD